MAMAGVVTRFDREFNVGPTGACTTAMMSDPGEIWMFVGGSDTPSVKYSQEEGGALMRVLVTGGLGNVGSFTMRELLQRGCSVRCLDLPSRGNLRTASRWGTSVEFIWGDIRNPADVDQAVDATDVIVHLASIIPPLAHEDPTLAESVNVDGTRQVFAAAARQPVTPRVLFASSFDVYGPTTHLSPPRVVSDPLIPTDNYSQHKIEGERELTTSGLTWAIYRFADMPILGRRPPHPMMFEIPLNTRMEVLHPADAAVAIAEGVTGTAIWNEIWLIGGGPTCQVTYAQYLQRMLSAMGLPMLPEAAFTTHPYCTDWLDTRASQDVLHFQRHTFDQIVQEVADNAGFVRHVAPLVARMVTRRLLRLSPYYPPEV